MNRVLPIFITAFWLFMWGLLLRTELQPEKTSLKEVPIEHVLKLFFQHQEPSDLFLMGEGGRIGHVRFHPQVSKEDGRRQIELTGNMQMKFPGAPRQRLGWEAAAEITPESTLRRARVRTLVREATTQAVPETNVLVDYDAESREIAYELSVDGQPLDKHRFTPDEAGLRQLLERSGIDPQILQTINLQARASSPRLMAHRATLPIRGEKVETVLVSLEVNEQTMIEFHVSQLGQILHARTLTGWVLQAD